MIGQDCEIYYVSQNKNKKLHPQKLQIHFSMHCYTEWQNKKEVKKKNGGEKKKFVTPTWFEHATFWSGVRRATIAPRSHPVNVRF